MPRKRIQAEPLNDAEKQRRYREKKRAEGKKRLWIYPEIAISAAKGPLARKEALFRETIKAELKAEWEPEMKQERLLAERKKGRELAKQADDTFARGRTTGICEAAAFFIGKDRVDIARFLLSHFMIDRKKAETALQPDKQTKSLTLEYLNKREVFRKPPLFI